MTPEFITTNAALNRCVEYLNTEDELSIDLEFDKNRFAYGFTLCLVQISTNDKCFIIDPLEKNLDIKLLFPPLENEQILKITYVFGEDLRLLHSIGCFPKNMFDISIATKLLDYAPASLSSVLGDVLNVETTKDGQKSNWLRRPLSDLQVNYAAQDVLHLIPLKESLIKEATQKGVLEWIDEENRVMDEQLFVDVDDNVVLKDKDKKGLTQFEWFLYKKLVDYREGVAKKHNKPSYQIIHKDDLLDMVTDLKKIENWDRSKRIYKHIRTSAVKNEIRKLVLDAEQEASELGISKTESARDRLSQEQRNTQRAERNRIDNLKKEVFKPIQKRISESYGENAAVFILGNRQMLALIEGKSDEMRIYKRKLILDAAKDLNINVQAFLQ